MQDFLVVEAFWFLSGVHLQVTFCRPAMFKQIKKVSVCLVFVFRLHHRSPGQVGCGGDQAAPHAALDAAGGPTGVQPRAQPEPRLVQGQQQ